MKKAIFLLLSFTICFANFAQKTADPKATQLLNKVKKEYNSYKTIKADFSIEIEVPDKGKTVNKGQLFQAGKKYKIVLPELTSFSDAKTVWTYIKKNKEIQITNFGEKENTPFISPQELISIYERKDQEYAITGESVINNIKTTEIEFKPKNERTDYFKIRLNIDANTSQILQAKVFYKDGTRYTMIMNKVVVNKPIDPSVFVYYAKDWTGIPVEDLRID
jgi:outer membrane lipoprotein-sorting protein